VGWHPRSGTDANQPARTSAKMPIAPRTATCSASGGRDGSASTACGSSLDLLPFRLRLVRNLRQILKINDYVLYVIDRMERLYLLIGDRIKIECKPCVQT
jgi:hypothetical protein